MAQKQALRRQKQILHLSAAWIIMTCRPTPGIETSCANSSRFATTANLISHQCQVRNMIVALFWATLRTAPPVRQKVARQLSPHPELVRPATEGCQTIQPQGKSSPELCTMWRLPQNLKEPRSSNVCRFCCSQQMSQKKAWR